MQNIGDGYIVNGWESMPYDNHSGIIDIYRNPKGDVSLFNYYTQPLYVAVSSRSQVVRLPGHVAVDFYIVNEVDLKGDYLLQINLLNPSGKVVHTEKKPVTIQGGELFGELLVENLTLPVSKEEGTYQVTTRVTDKNGMMHAEGYDNIVAVDWSGDDLKGKGAYYGKPDDKFASFYVRETGKPVEAFNPQMDKLDWLVVTRPSLDEPTIIDPDFFKNKAGESTLRVNFFSDDDMGAPTRSGPDIQINRSFADSAQPDPSVPANQAFSVVWEGELLPVESGQYLIGLYTTNGVRLFINGTRIIDEWSNRNPPTLDRPVDFEAGKPATIRVEYSQQQSTGEIQLRWSQPAATVIEPQQIIDRVKNDGTTLVLLDTTEAWMDVIKQNTEIQYNGYYSVGRNWVGGVHFVKEHPLFKGLPVNDGLNWPYQAVVRQGDSRFGLRIEGKEMVVGSYRSTPFELGTAVGIILCGKGEIIFSTLDILANLDQISGSSEVAKKILCNYINYAAGK
ncbi:MAG: PA14 domain-containing protein [Bacteroides sp.]|nr:PA14 domain-containing protein [Bacteroides sp.]